MDSPREREITTPVDLCDANGRLNADAVGWSRIPLHNCNLKGAWPRKKQWNYWAVMDRRFLFSATISNADYIGPVFCYFIDFEKKEMLEKTIPTPFGAGCKMPPRVEEDISYSHPKFSFSMLHRGSEIHMKVESPAFQGKKLSADVVISKPEGHETLSVVVPWSRRLFQFTSKHNTLPAAGTVTLDGVVRSFEPAHAFAVLDYGRGVWPYQTAWNWSAMSTRQGENVIGWNLGGQWTDGTGSTENGICLNGILHKISDDVLFDCDRRDYMKPWHIHTRRSSDVEIEFTPFFDRHTKTNMGVLKSECHQMFGHFKGEVKAGDRTLEIDGPIGWAEEHFARW